MKQAYFAALAAVFATAFMPGPAHAQYRNPWNGLYVGLHGGYAWQDVNGVFNNIDLPTSLNGTLDGGIVGGQVGYNYQSGQFLLGVETDLSTLAQGGRHVTVDTGPLDYQTLSVDSSYIGSVRARLGWAINNWLLYGTVGWGYSQFKFSETDTSLPFHGKMKLNDSGVVFGGGVEWMVSYGVSLRGEYLRYDLGRDSSLPSWFPDVDVGDRVGFNSIDVARAALNIKLGN